MHARRLVCLALVSLAAACSGSTSGSSGDSTSGSGGSAGSAGSAGSSGVGGSSGAGGSDPGKSWVTLSQTDWSLAPGEEKYLCVTFTLPSEVIANAFRPIAPVGTHHTVVTYGTSTEPDGVKECHVNDLLPNLVFASGVGTNEYDLPAGVGVKLAAGQKLHLQLHLFNTSASPLTGTSGVEYVPLDASALVDEAEFVLAGTEQLDIPPGSVTQTGTCTIPADTELFSVWPHMHQLGVHQKVTLVPASGAPTVLLDTAYDFSDQVFHDMAPHVQLHAGDRIQVDCTYQNTTASTVQWGESTTTEMCYAGLYRFPRVGHTPSCTH